MSQHHMPQTGNADAVNVGAAARVKMEGGQQPVVQLADIIAVTARLAQVLAEEVDLLDAMRIRDMEGLQEEKRKLIRSLTMMKRELDRQPDAKANFAPGDVQAFHQVSQIFNEILQENHRRLLVAKEINLQVVQAIADVVKEESERAGYSRKGGKKMGKDAPPSISLNETI